MTALMIAIIGIILTILFIVGTHEFGHFMTAKLLGIKVLRFSIGFGKALYRFKSKKGTEYIIAAIPLGGYVQMLDETEGNVLSTELSQAFNRQPFYKKALVVIAGPAINFFCAFFLYWLIFIIGFTTIKPVIGQVTPHSIAAQAGLKPQQEILRINGSQTLTWTSVIFRLMVHVEEETPILVEAKNIQVPMASSKIYYVDASNWQLNQLTPDVLSSIGLAPLMPNSKQALMPLLRHIQYQPVTAIWPAVKEVYNFIYFNTLLLGKMLTGKLSLQGLGGPITIVEGVGTAINNGMIPFFGFIAFLSISIGFINLLPIPGLDGGHLLIYFIEFLIRRPIPLNVLYMLYRLGLFFIILLCALALTNDLLRL